MSESDSLAAIPCTRDRLEKEFSDGSLAVRLKIDSDDVGAFWEGFPDIDSPAYLANGVGAVECVRGALMREFADGSLGVRILVDPRFKADFRRLWPHPGMPAVLACESPDFGRKVMQAETAAANPAPQYGQHAKALRTHVKFMGSPKVWRAVGSDEDFLAWLRTRPCGHCKWVPHWENDVFVPCHAAHVRRVASGAGTAIKPEYSAVPLCPPGQGKGCHAQQHSQGESYLGGKEEVDKLRLNYVHEWVWAALKENLGYSHMNEVPPETLVAWAGTHGLLEYLPKTYLEDL